MQKIALPFAACLLALAAVGAQAQPVWKWRDAAGQLHISDKAPPADTPARNIISSPAGGVAPTLTPDNTSTTAAAPVANGGAAANGAASGAETALEKKKKAAEKERADKEQAEHAARDAQNAAIRKDNCSRAQSSQATIQSGQRLARTGANGEREVLDDAARADELRRTQDAIAANCGTAPAAR